LAIDSAVARLGVDAARRGRWAADALPRPLARTRFLGLAAARDDALVLDAGPVFAEAFPPGPGAAGKDNDNCLLADDFD
jgi:hypothetical protein